MEEEILNRMQALPERKNPFDEGIAKAVFNSRSNLGMNRDQEHRAINNALLTLGNGLAKEPIQRGFKNNLGVFGRAMNPALAAYNTSEDAAFKENEQLANQILQHQRAQEALEASKQEKAWNHKFQERQLEETKRYHNLLDNFRRDKIAEKQEKENPYKEIDGKIYSKLDPVQKRKVGDLKKITRNTLDKLKHTSQLYEQLKAKTEDNYFFNQPTGLIANYGGNLAKNIYGEVFNDKKLKKENDLRNVFFSELGQVRTLAEKANTGGTSVGVGMYDRLKNYFANENDSMAVLKAKLDFSLKEIEKADKEARISSEYGIDYEIEEEANGSPTQEIIDENDLGDL